ncbi:uncharacterized protein LOC106653725 isoform X1 [Trichogramma pretiosum]|uniref:uncharacterized protein LOC106653725 isoform X1 n=2 Tax=Trichogramma pretiosum TaxID=7493 RepID=UPI0006C960F1|nr:uncharacterized protein LOC106653725 isoform X1 [Trichogramma pretiosum]
MKMCSILTNRRHVRARKDTSFAALLLFLICFNDSYPVLNSSEVNDTEINLVADTFENYISQDDFCHGKSCRDAYESADYPYEKMVGIFNFSMMKDSFARHNLKDSSMSSGGVQLYAETARGFQNSMFDVRIAEPMCEEIYRRIYPIKGKGVNGGKYFVVNVPDFKQGIDVKSCYKNKVSCGDDGSRPENYQRNCQQQYEVLELFAISVGDNVTKSQVKLEKFRNPSGCACQESRVSSFLNFFFS